jgi:hypothetical protein
MNFGIALLRILSLVFAGCSTWEEAHGNYAGAALSLGWAILLTLWRRWP